MNDHEQRIELLDEYWAALREDLAAPAPAGLDENLAHLTLHLEQNLRPAGPDAAFATELGRKLDRQAIAIERERRSAGNPRRLAHLPLPRLGWQMGALAAAALVLIALVTLAPWLSSPRAVNAEVILEKAQAAATNLAGSGVRSFNLSEVITTSGRNRLAPEGGETRSEQQVWYQAPDEIRLEQKYTLLPGRAPEADARVTVSDGQTLWNYDPAQKLAQVTTGQIGATGLGGASLVAPYGGEDLTQVLESARTCGDPKVTGEDRVAGRPAYVVDLGINRCPSASAGSPNGPQTVWIDKDTFFVLKRVVHSDDGASVVYSSEVTRVQYNRDISADVFSFTPPPGAQIQDNRPQPAPSATEFQQQLAQIAAQADFPVFVPRHLPAGLVPRVPRTDGGPKLGVELEYVPAPEAATDIPPETHGLRISEMKANEESLVQIAQQAQSATVSGGPAWARPGTTNADGTASSSNVFLLRDGTLIILGSMSLSVDELITVANSLEAVPGGHTPLANPPAPAGAPAPTPVPTPTFAILRPSWLPENMTVREQYIPNRFAPGSGVLLGFDPRPGDPPHMVLTLEELPGGQMQFQDPQASVEQIGGREVTIVRRGQGCVTAVWVQDGIQLTLTNPYDPPGSEGQVRYTCGQLQQIIASVR